ncbi:HipA domain-containing protein [Roseateles sp. PN1]|uniref:HipA domain-containing protein n=1 Tax=Roseateles sp. PN1 TaxID=3137372 RepID=UPI003138C819
MRRLDAYLNDRKVGTLSEGDDLWRFCYEPSWVDAPDGFDLSPGLPRSEPFQQDGGSQRPVQWYFDNLLPEETLREAVSKEAQIKGDDAFALLEYLGAESAGSLVLLPPGKTLPARGERRALSDADLCQRIQNLPRATLSSGAPKRMSAAGAQHKLLVIYQNDALFEPVGAEPSTHILKPNHLSDDYAASVINEYITMRLGQTMLGTVPEVYRRYTPEPVYIVARFDRYADGQGLTQRRHIIDACQLLNKARSFKYRHASLTTLADIVACCRNRASTRLRLFSWLVFNVLIGNDDCHLKNLSFLVTSDGIELAPFYDLLSTAVYHTRAFAEERATWPAVNMMIPLPNARRFGEVTRASILEAGEALGLPQRVSERELSRMMAVLVKALPNLVAEIEAENQGCAENARPYLGNELRLVRTLQHVVVPEILGRMAA